MADAARRRVLMSAYACEPGGGSENGVGWSWAVAAAQDHEVWLLTRRNNAPAIEHAIAASGDLELHTVYLDLPEWARAWKKGLRGHRTYYALWQGLARREARRLMAEVRFDVVHHVTFASDSLPAGVVGAGGVPAIWGPVGGAQDLPPTMRQWIGRRASVGERARTAWLGVLRRTFGDRAARNAALVLALNPIVADRFAGRAERIEVRPNIALDPDELGAVAPTTAPNPVPTAVFAGRLLAWKGLRLAVAALAQPPAAAWRLAVYGSGPDCDAARALAAELGVDDRVSFHGQVDRSELLIALSNADALIHPAMHDSSPWVVGEAMELGTPVVCLDHAGPPAILGSIGGIAVPVTGDVPGSLAQALEDVRGTRVASDGRWLSSRLPGELRTWYGLVADER